MSFKAQAVVVANLGSPDAPDKRSLRKYLREFLMDEYVIDAPYLIRWMIVHLFILPFRPAKSAELYKSIWQKEGSPLVLYTEKFSRKLAEKVNLPVRTAMRYGNPSLEKVLGELKNEGYENIAVFSMYPQYAMSSSMTLEKKVEKVAAKLGLKTRVSRPYYNHKAYIDALAEVTLRALPAETDYFLSSFHGIPERHVEKTDPTGNHCLKVDNCCEKPSPAHATCYRHQCFETARLLREKLKISENESAVSFQSRLGRNPWLRPYTDFKMKELGEAGVENLAVCAPSFTADCLETLEELKIQNRDFFKDAGGGSFNYLPALNTADVWVDAAAMILAEQFDGISLR